MRTLYFAVVVSIGSLGHPSKFQQVSRLGVITARTSLTGGQPNFARCLAVSWAGTLTLRRGTVNGIAELSQRAPPIFGTRLAEKYRMQKFAKNSPSAHHRTNSLDYIRK